MVYDGKPENPIEMDDLGVPFIFGNTHINGNKMHFGIHRKARP